jgi:predicted transcriptional regulator
VNHQTIGTEHQDPINLQQIRANIVELERCLETMKAMVRPMDGPSAVTNSAVDFSPTPESLKITEKSVRKLLKTRTLREHYFGSDLFADPAWDMLLDLYACELGQTRVSVSGLCAAANAPPTTGLRYIGKLEQDGWIERHADPRDRRRYWVELSDKGLEAIRQYMAMAWPTLTAA